jgi:hypothetical protein
MLCLNLEEDASVADGCEDFATMADDACVLHKFFDFVIVILSYYYRIEVIKREAEVFTLGQDRIPGESGLKSLQYQKLKMLGIIVYRNSPLVVVIVYIELVFETSSAAVH